MSDTPRTDAARPPYTELQEFVSAKFASTLERELNAANDRIKLLEAVINDPHALWANWLRGSVTLPVGIGDVRQYQERIKRLEEAGGIALAYAEKGDYETANKAWLLAKEAHP
jgi:hypothetical protein